MNKIRTKSEAGLESLLFNLRMFAFILIFDIATKFVPKKAVATWLWISKIPTE